MSTPECKGTCEYHKDRDSLISDIDDVVNQHKGYWKFFFWGAAFAITLIGFLTSNINDSVKEIEASVNRMEKFVAIGEVNHTNNVMRLDNVEEHLGAVDTRLRSLETNHFGNN